MIAQGSTDHTSKQIPLFLQQMTSKLSFVHRQERQLGLRLLTSAALVLKKSRARDWSRQNQGAQHVIVREVTNPFSLDIEGCGLRR